MFSFFSPKHEFGVVYHIGSASVGAGLVTFRKGKVPFVEHVLRELIPHRETVDPERFLADMVDTLNRVNGSLAKTGLSNLSSKHSGKMRIGKVTYVFSSPWSVTQTKISTISDPKGFVFTKEHVSRIIRENEKAFEEKAMGSVSKIKHLLQTIEKRIIQIKLNGYEVSDPYGKRATRADVSLFVSISPKAVIDKVFDVSMSTYHPKNTQAYSFPLVSFSAIRNAFGGEKSYVFLDVGGELSDISVVKDGLVLETASFPLGKHSFLRRVALTLGTTLEETRSLVSLYESGKADSSLSDKLRPAISAGLKEWFGGLEKVFRDFSSRISLPTKLFVLMNGDLASLFVQTLKQEKIKEFEGVDVSHSVILLNHEKLKNVVDFDKDAGKDPSIALIASFVGSVYDSKEK